MRTVNVTDHALVRYIERVAGIDLTEVRAAIRAHVREAMRAGAHGVQKDGFIYKLDPHSQSVLTVIKKGFDK